MTYQKFITSLLIIYINCSTHHFLKAQSEFIVFGHLGDGDIRMMLDPNKTKGINEYRLGIGYNQHIVERKRFFTSIGFGYAFHHFLRPHYFLNDASPNIPLSELVSKNTQYHNGFISLNLKYQISKSLNISLVTANELTFLLATALPQKEVIKDHFRYDGSSVFLGLGIKRGNHVWTPQVRVFMVKPTDPRIWNEKFASLSPEYVDQIDDQFNFNNTFQIGIQYAYLFIKEHKQKHKKGKLICD